MIHTWYKCKCCISMTVLLHVFRPMVINSGEYFRRDTDQSYLKCVKTIIIKEVVKSNGNHQRLRNVIPLPLTFVVLYFETLIMKICALSNILSIVFINFSYSLCHIVSNQINFIITFLVLRWICGAESNRLLRKCWFFHLLLPKCFGPHYPQLQNES